MSDDIGDEEAGLKDRQNALSERFAKHRDADPTDTTDTADTSTASDAGGAGDASDTDDAGDTGGSGGSVRDRPQTAMYLPEELRERLLDVYEKLDARSKLDDDGEIEKHRHFYEGLVECALDSDDLEEYVREKRDGRR
ncbi:hypothetical protein ACERIT_08780 [Halopenitus sp. H-Gu1]|uniref:hypothetical protein n=1 Tax=Halopenitus sp. H-Gu1 TaxID=3242697 RepID=UPI00359D7794